MSPNGCARRLPPRPCRTHAPETSWALLLKPNAQNRRCSGSPPRCRLLLAAFCMVISCTVGGLGCMHSAFAFLNDTTNESVGNPRRLRAYDDAQTNVASQLCLPGRTAS